MEEGRGDLNLDFPYEGEKIMPLELQDSWWYKCSF